MRHQNKNILKNPRFVLGAGATSLAMITALQIFSSCKSESENIQKSHAEAANNSGIAGLYDYVQTYVRQHSSRIKKTITHNPEDKISIYIRIRISREGNVIYTGAQVNCHGTGCINFNETGLEDLHNEISTMNIGSQSEDREISIPVYID